MAGNVLISKRAKNYIFYIYNLVVCWYHFKYFYQQTVNTLKS